ncbi:MAG TPA: type 4a pilus biogenesis protein PilO [Pirellulaceae bacterium]|jgi:Tfp pilus assembly protein PilO|nr:type 4a pilus biogenesis protein PilO [Pirellulaceae bacterium]
MSGTESQLLLERLGKRRVPVCVLLGAAAVAYAFFVFRPAQLALGQEMAKVEQVRLEALGGSREAEGLARLEDEIAVAQAFFARCEERASSERRRGALLSGLSRAAEESGLSLQAMQPDQGTRYETFDTLVVRLEATGRYESFVAFLSKVQRLPFATQIQECRLSAATPEGEGQTAPGNVAGPDGAVISKGDLAGSFVFVVFAGSAVYSVNPGQPLADR